MTLPDGQWVFVALVVEPDRATITMGESGVLASAVNLTAHSPEEFDGVTLIGRDSTGNSRYFEGGIDDVRIYDAALSPAQIAALYAASQ